MRIGLAADFYYPWIGGPSILLRNLARALADRGHSVSLLVPSPTGPAYVERDGAARVYRVQTLPSPVGHNLRVALRAPAAARAWLREMEPDVVHVHHPFPIGAATILGARRAGVPVVSTNHTIPACSLWGIRSTGPLNTAATAAFGRWIAWLMKRSDAVVTPSKLAADELRTMGFAGEISVISNGVDTERFQPGREGSASLRGRLHLDQRPVVLYTGRLDAEKSMDLWLRTAAAVRQRHRVQFVIGGEGTERSRLEGAVRRLGISADTRFVGYVSDDDLPDLYRLADVYFIASTVELQSITTLEAMASGLPVVAAAAAALPELVAGGVNGVLFAPGDEAAARDALGNVLGDAELREGLGAGARATALRHDLRQSIDAYERLLLEIATRERGTRHLERAVIAGR